MTSIYNEFKIKFSKFFYKKYLAFVKYFIKLFHIENRDIQMFLFRNIGFVMYLIICIIISFILNLFFQLFLFLFIFTEIRQRIEDLETTLNKQNIYILNVNHDDMFNCTILSFSYVFCYLMVAYFFRSNILILILTSLLITFFTIDFFNINLKFKSGLMYRNFKLKETSDLIKDYYDKKEKDENIKEILAEIFLEFPEVKNTFEDKFKNHKINFKIMSRNNISRESIYKRVNKVLNIFILKNK